jgi:hypothetical protein
VVCTAFAANPDQNIQTGGYACTVETVALQPDGVNPMFKLIVYLFGEDAIVGTTLVKPTHMKLWVQFYKSELGSVALNATVRTFETAKHVATSQDVQDNTATSPEESIDFDSLGFFSFETDYFIGSKQTRPVLSTDITPVTVIPDTDSRKQFEVQFCFTGAPALKGNLVWDPKLGVYDQEVADAIEANQLAANAAAGLVPSLLAALALAAALLF